MVWDTWVLGDTLCHLQGFLLVLFIIAIHFSLMMIAIDRNYAIVNSLRYQYVFDQTLCHTLIAFTWVLGVITATPPLLGWGSFKYNPNQFICTVDWTRAKAYSLFLVSVGVMLPLLIQSWCYLCIIKAAFSHTQRRKKIAPKSSSMSDANSNITESAIVGTIPNGCRRTEYKAARTILFIASAYWLTWLPYIMTFIMDMTSPNQHHRLQATTACFLLLTSVINPLIYVFMNKVTRMEIIKMLRKNSPDIPDRMPTAINRNVFFPSGVRKLSFITKHRVSNLNRADPRLGDMELQVYGMSTIKEVTENDGSGSGSAMSVNSKRVKKTRFHKSHGNRMNCSHLRTKESTDPLENNGVRVNRSNDEIKMSPMPSDRISATSLPILDLPGIYPTRKLRRAISDVSSLKIPHRTQVERCGSFLYL